MRAQCWKGSAWLVGLASSLLWPAAWQRKATGPCLLLPDRMAATGDQGRVAGVGGLLTVLQQGQLLPSLFRPRSVACFHCFSTLLWDFRLSVPVL